MILLVLGLIFLVTLVLMLLGAVFTIFMITRYWNVLRPIAVSALLLLGGVAFFDALASTHAVRCAEEGEPGASAPGGTAAESALEQRIRDSALRPGGGTAPVSAAYAEIPLNDPQAPEWTRRKPGEMNTAQEVVEITVHAGPCLSLPECEAQLAKELITTVDDYVRMEITQAPGVDVAVPLPLIEKSLVRDTHVSRTRREVLPSRGAEEMVDLYALVKIDRDGRKQLRELWRESVVQGRMKAAGAALVGVLAVLSLGWAVLRRQPRSTPVRAGS